MFPGLVGRRSSDGKAPPRRPADKLLSLCLRIAPAATRPVDMCWLARREAAPIPDGRWSLPELSHLLRRRTLEPNRADRVARVADVIGSGCLRQTRCAGSSRRPDGFIHGRIPRSGAAGRSNRSGRCTALGPPSSADAGFPDSLFSVRRTARFQPASERFRRSAVSESGPLACSRPTKAQFRCALPQPFPSAAWCRTLSPAPNRICAAPSVKRLQPFWNAKRPCTPGRYRSRSLPMLCSSGAAPVKRCSPQPMRWDDSRVAAFSSPEHSVSVLVYANMRKEACWRIPVHPILAALREWWGAPAVPTTLVRQGMVKSHVGAGEWIPRRCVSSCTRPRS